MKTIGDVLRVRFAFRKTNCLGFGFVRPGMYGEPASENPKLLRAYVVLRCGCRLALQGAESNCE